MFPPFFLLFKRCNKRPLPGIALKARVLEISETFSYYFFFFTIFVSLFDARGPVSRDFKLGSFNRKHLREERVSPFWYLHIDRGRF